MVSLPASTDQLDLERIKARLSALAPSPIRDNIDRQLVAEIERLRGRLAKLLGPSRPIEEYWAESDRLDQLRDRLRSLEWSAVPGPVPDARCCPACKVVRGRIGRHAPTCWLALAAGLPHD